MDFSSLDNIHEIDGVINDSITHIRNKPRSSLYCLTDITYMRFSNDIKRLFQDFTEGNKPYIKASALVGLSGLQQIIYNGLMKLTGCEISSFTTLEEAKDWLAAKN